MTPRERHSPAAFRFHAFWLMTGVLLVLLVIVLSLVPDPALLPATPGDKPMHLLAYAALMSWFANLHAEAGRRMRIACGLVALGIALEYVQQWTGYRTCDGADMTANAAGVATGWLLAPPRMPNYLRGLEQLLAG